LGFPDNEVDILLQSLYEEYLEVVNDRLIKSGSGISRKAEKNQQELDVEEEYE
jgi:hypothetical protein